MNKILNFFKKYWLFTLLGCLAVVLLGLRLFIVSKSPAPSRETSEPTAKPAFGTLPEPKSVYLKPLDSNLNYQINLLTTEFNALPKILPVYQLKKITEKEATDLVEPIIKAAKLTESEKTSLDIGTFLTWTKDDNYLDLNLTSGQFSFGGQLPLTTDQNTTITLPEAKRLVQEKLIDWDLISKEAAVIKTQGFGVAGRQLVPAKNLQSATVWQIVFEPEINLNGFSLIGIGGAQNLIEAKIDNQGNLIGLFFNLHQIDYEQQASYPRKDYSETITEIKSGQAQIIEIFDPEKNESLSLPEDKINFISIDSFSIAYYETGEAQDYYQPIFLFKGYLTTKKGDRFQTTLLLPAITSEWLGASQEHFEF